MNGFSLHIEPPRITKHKNKLGPGAPADEISGSAHDRAFIISLEPNAHS